MAFRAEHTEVDVTREGHGGEGGGGRDHRVVKLLSGGSLLLSVDVNVLKLSGTDRTFLFGLTDQMDAYEANTKAAKAAADAAAGPSPVGG